MAELELLNGRMAHLATVFVALLLTLAAEGCGSSGPSTSTAVFGGAPVETPRSAPAYCRMLTSDKALLALSGAMTQLATAHDDAAARTSMRAAAAEVSSAALQAPLAQAHVLVRVATALRTLAARGPSAAVALNNAFTHAGSVLGRSCRFPVA